MIHFSNEVWQSMAHLGWISAVLWVGVNIAGWALAAGTNYVNENKEAVNFLPWGNTDTPLVGILVMYSSILAFAIPYIVLGLISIYPVPLFLLTTYGVLRVARGAKRISRKLTVHTVDPEAHKNA